MGFCKPEMDAPSLQSKHAKDSEPNVKYEYCCSFRGSRREQRKINVVHYPARHYRPISACGPIVAFRLWADSSTRLFDDRVPKSQTYGHRSVTEACLRTY